MTAVLWTIAIVLILVGIAGSFLPALPGLPLIFAGMLLAAWINNFQLIGVPVVVALAVLTVLGVAIDHAAAVLYAQRAGASKQGIIGAVLGTVAGLFTGFWGLVFMPLAGAAIGEYLAHRDMLRAGKIGAATWYGLLAAAVLKLAITFTMLGVFIAALLI